MSNPQTIAEKFIVDVVGVDEDELTSETDLLLSGILDSLSVIRLVHHLESELHVSVPFADIHPGNFGTLSAIGRYLEGLVAVTTQTG